MHLILLKIEDYTAPKVNNSDFRKMLYKSYTEITELRKSHYINDVS